MGSDERATLSWERHHGYVEVDSATLTALVQPAFPGATVASAKLVTTGKCNTNYQVHLAGRDEPVLLRIYTRDPSTCGRERRLFELLDGRVPVPRVFYAAEATDAFPFPYAVQSWLEGAHLAVWLTTEPEADALPVARQLGGILAELTRITFPSAGFLGPDLEVMFEFDDAVGFLLEHTERWLFESQAPRRMGRPLRDRVWELICRDRPLLDQVRDSRHLVHSDYGPWNLLVGRGASGPEVTGVLDWEYTGSGTWLLDAGNLLRRAELLPPGFEAAFAEGFEANGCALPRHWRRMSRVYDMVCLSQMLATPDERPTQHADIVRLIEASVRDWDK
jgi:aminoglycoside phosphotransferase (APT) family kinase protein